MLDALVLLLAFEGIWDCLFDRQCKVIVGIAPACYVFCPAATFPGRGRQGAGAGASSETPLLRKSPSQFEAKPIVPRLAIRELYSWFKTFLENRQSA